MLQTLDLKHYKNKFLLSFPINFENFSEQIFPWLKIVRPPLDRAYFFIIKEE